MNRQTENGGGKRRTGGRDRCQESEGGAREGIGLGAGRNEGWVDDVGATAGEREASAKEGGASTSRAAEGVVVCVGVSKRGEEGWAEDRWRWWRWELLG